MVDAIVYNTNTGFTKQFAYRFALKTHLPIYSISESRKLPKNATIIYFSWIRNGEIQELKHMKKKFSIAYVCAVGLTRYSDEYIEKLKLDNEIDNLFYLRGGLRYPLLNQADKKMFKEIKESLEKRSMKFHLSNDEADMLFMVTNGYESIDLDALNPLIDWVLDAEESIVS